jgi:hypothetical protein
MAEVGCCDSETKEYGSAMRAPKLQPYNIAQELMTRA